MSAVAGGLVQSADITAVTALTTARPLVRLIQQSAQSLTTATNTALTFGSGSEDIDTHNFHDPSTNTSRVTPTAAYAGYYRVTGTVWFATAVMNDQQYQLFVGKNGAIIPPGSRARHNSTTTTQRSISTSSMVSANGTTDYFEIITVQNTGVSLNTQIGGGINSVMEVEFLRPL